MDSRKLGYFVAVVDHEGFTAAAKAVFVSQPALSLAVKDLEAEGGAQLFTRIGHRVRLTAAGSALLEPARQVLRDLETGRAAVAAVTGLLSGSLSLASLPTLAADPMASMVGEFRCHHQGVRVDLAAPEDSDDLFSLVESGASELGLTDAADVPQTLAAVTLSTKRSCSSFPQALQPQKEIPSRLWISGKSRSWWLHWAHQPVGCWTSSLAHSAANRLLPSSPPSVRPSFPLWWPVPAPLSSRKQWR